MPPASSTARARSPPATRASRPPSTARARARGDAADGEALAASGSAAAAIDILAGRGEWERAHELAARAGPELAAATAARHAQQLLRAGDAAGAARVLASHSAGAGAEAVALVSDVAAAVFGAPQAEADQQAEQDARAAALRLVEQLDLLPGAPGGDASASAAGSAAAVASDLFWASHLTASAPRAQAAGLHELAARQLTAALRHAGRWVPADRAFYEAGAAWRAAGRERAAYVLLNHYLDIAEAIDEGGADGGGAAAPPAAAGDFEGTDIAWAAAAPPRRHYCAPGAREAARDFVLELSMGRAGGGGSGAGGRGLGLRRCEACAAETYEANLACHACGHRWASGLAGKGGAPLGLFS